MDPIPVPVVPKCPNCGTTVFPTDAFCPHCGYNLLQKKSIGLGRQLYIYLVALLLPPFGLVWTFKYLFHGTPSEKRIAIIAACITIISVVVTIWFTVGFFAQIQNQYNGYSNLGL